MLAASGSAYELVFNFGRPGPMVEGEPMQLHTLENYSTGTPTTVWIGVAHAGAARVVYVLEDGTQVEGQIAEGVDRHDTVFFADVSGPLDRVLAYDAAGELLEEHEILPCSGAADCEIR